MILVASCSNQLWLFLADHCPRAHLQIPVTFSFHFGQLYQEQIGPEDGIRDLVRSRGLEMCIRDRFYIFVLQCTVHNIPCYGFVTTCTVTKIPYLSVFEPRYKIWPSRPFILCETTSVANCYAHMFLHSSQNSNISGNVF